MRRPGQSFGAGIAHGGAQFDAVFHGDYQFSKCGHSGANYRRGFFDHLEGQEGVAPNGVELHPIIDIISTRISRSRPRLLR